jgi:hypothetical protein
MPAIRVVETGDELHRAEFDDFVPGRPEDGGFHIECDDGAVAERAEQGVERIAIVAQPLPNRSTKVDPLTQK